MTTAISEVLELTRKIVENGWIQGLSAIDVYGRTCDPTDDDVIRCCLKGAIRRAEWQLFRKSTLNSGALLVLNELLPEGQTVVYWNDRPERTKTEVLELIDRGILELTKQRNRHS